MDHLATVTTVFNLADAFYKLVNTLSTASTAQRSFGVYSREIGSLSRVIDSITKYYDEAISRGLDTESGNWNDLKLNLRSLTKNVKDLNALINARRSFIGQLLGNDKKTIDALREIIDKDLSVITITLIMIQRYFSFIKFISDSISCSSSQPPVPVDDNSPSTTPPKIFDENSRANTSTGPIPPLILYQNYNVNPRPKLQYIGQWEFNLPTVRLQSIAISITGEHVVLLTSNDYTVFTVTDPPHIQSTGKVNFVGTKNPQKKWASSYAALNSQFLAIGIGSKLQAIQVAENSPKYECDVDIDQSIDFLTFSPNCRELLVLTHDGSLQYARIHSIVVDDAGAHFVLIDTVSWPLLPINKFASFSRDGTHVAICTEVNATGTAQIRLLHNSNGVWRNILPLMIQIGSPQSILSNRCEGLTGVGLYNLTYWSNNN